MTARSRSRRKAAPPVLLGVLLGAGWIPSPAGAQSGASVRVEENLRAAPNGEVIARLFPATPLRVLDREDRWIRVTIEGWVWMASLRTRDGGNYDLVVSARGGENLRAEPQGTVVGRLEQGTLLEEVERRTGWVRVRRSAWIWGPSVRDGAAVPPAPAATGGRPTAGRTAGAGGGGTPAASSGRVFRAPEDGGVLLSTPDGDTLARLPSGTEVSETAREGNWVRVRLEGWIWDPPGRRGGGEVAEVSPAEVIREPAQWEGRIVTWSLQFIALERAERVRTDFYEGEPYLLAREGAGAGTFIYVAIPPGFDAEIRGLSPLERILVTGRIRTGTSAFTGVPILDLLELRRGGR